MDTNKSTTGQRLSEAIQDLNMAVADTVASVLDKHDINGASVEIDVDRDYIHGSDGRYSYQIFTKLTFDH